MASAPRPGHGGTATPPPDGEPRILGGQRLGAVRPARPVPDRLAAAHDQELDPDGGHRCADDAQWPASERRCRPRRARRRRPPPKPSLRAGQSRRVAASTQPRTAAASANTPAPSNDSSCSSGARIASAARPGSLTQPSGAGGAMPGRSRSRARSSPPAATPRRRRRGPRGRSAWDRPRRARPRRSRSRPRPAGRDDGSERRGRGADEEGRQAERGEHEREPAAPSGPASSTAPWRGMRARRVARRRSPIAVPARAPRPPRAGGRAGPGRASRELGLEHVAELGRRRPQLRLRGQARVDRGDRLGQIGSVRAQGGIPWPIRRTVCAGLAAAAGFSPTSTRTPSRRASRRRTRAREAAVGLLGRHVGERADDLAGGGQRRRAGDRAIPKSMSLARCPAP